MWASELVGLRAAWGLSRGAGVLVAHPDTGFRRHPELNNVREDIDYDFYEQDDEPSAADGLRGLGTGSVLSASTIKTASCSAARRMPRWFPLRVTAPLWYKPGAVLLGMSHERHGRCFDLSVAVV